ncbi:MAG: hypothetical protein QOG08_715 [Chloroflexota bacterium]|jgi:hypothetical protein|nr:hypothetical protein [Chloroflexota bacterium]
MQLMTPQLAAAIYLFSTHITRTKIIVGIAVAVVLVVAVGVWLMRRRKVRA